MKIKLLGAVVACLFVGGCAPCMASGNKVLPDEVAVHAILGEALHDSESMRVMAHAIMNRYAKRGDLMGVYGLRVPMSRFDGKLRARALKAYKTALLDKVDPTKGATHWLSDYDLKHCKPKLTKFRFKMTETLYQGQTHYYREA